MSTRTTLQKTNDERGAVPTLAIFVIFVILITFTATQSFQSSYQRQSYAIQQRQAATTTEATLKAIESELNNALYTAVYTAVYEVGRLGENKENVEDRIRKYLNDRISGGWEYSNFKSIEIPEVNEKNLRFEWQPDGSVRATGYLVAKAEHVMGPRAYGVKLNVAAAPRFERLKQVANLVYGLELLSENLAQLENDLNENFAPEGIRFIIEDKRNNVLENVTAQDLWAARRVILG